MASHQNSALRTSLRSAIQATDSTWRGCQANRAATRALRQNAAVMRRSSQEKQEAVGGVQEEAGQMMPAGVEAEELAIEHVAEDGEGMPVAGDLGVQGVAKAGRGHAGLHDGIGGDEVGVVVIDEFVAGHGPIDGEGDRGQKQANPQGLAAGRRSWRGEGGVTICERNSGFLDGILDRPDDPHFASATIKRV